MKHFFCLPFKSLINFFDTFCHNFFPSWYDRKQNITSYHDRKRNITSYHDRKRNITSYHDGKRAFFTMKSEGKSTYVNTGEVVQKGKLMFRCVPAFGWISGKPSIHPHSRKTSQHRFSFTSPSSPWYVIYYYPIE